MIYITTIKLRGYYRKIYVYAICESYDSLSLLEDINEVNTYIDIHTEKVIASVYTKDVRDTERITESDSYNDVFTTIEKITNNIIKKLVYDISIQL